MGTPALEEWFSFSIRRNRKSYILATFALIGVMLAVGGALWFFSPNSSTATLIILVFAVPYSICSYSLTAQRFRDFNLTGWLALLWIPVSIVDGFVGGAASLAFAITLFTVPGTEGDNRYGPDPLAAN